MSILRKIIVYNNINKEEDRFYNKIVKYLSERRSETVSSFV
jgi:hypothetical protein